MKRISATVLMVFAAGLGALTHHLMDHPGDSCRKTAHGPVARDELQTLRKAQEISKLATELYHAGYTDCERLFDQRLSALKPEDFPLLAKQLESRNSYFWFGNGKLSLAVFEYWAAVDVRGLLEAVAGSQQPTAIPGILATCLHFDRGATADFVHRLAASRGAKAIALLGPAGINQLSAEEAKRLLKSAQKEGLLKEADNQATEGLLAVWVRKEPSAAIAFAGDSPALLKKAVSAWLGEDPAAAVAWMNGPGLSQVDRGMKEELLQSFAFASPEQAVRLIEEVADKNGFQKQIAQRRLQDHPERAEEIIAQVQDKTGLFESMTELVVLRPPAEIAAWVKTIPESGREAVCNQILNDLTGRDTDMAVAFGKLLPDLVPHPEGDLLQWFSQIHLPAAVELLQSGNLSGAVREKALPQIVGEWLKYDRAAALAFLEAQPPSEAIGRLKLEVSGAMDGGPDAALAFALALPDESLRVGACRFILTQHFFGGTGSGAESGEARSEKWLAELPASVRKALEPPPPPPPPVEEPAGDPFAADPFSSK